MFQMLSFNSNDLIQKSFVFHYTMTRVLCRRAKEKYIEFVCKVYIVNLLPSKDM